jgi:hypothetical protein
MPRKLLLALGFTSALVTVVALSMKRDLGEAGQMVPTYKVQRAGT